MVTCQNVNAFHIHFIKSMFLHVHVYIIILGHFYITMSLLFHLLVKAFCLMLHNGTSCKLSVVLNASPLQVACGCAYVHMCVDFVVNLFYTGLWRRMLIKGGQLGA